MKKIFLRFSYLLIIGMLFISIIGCNINKYEWLDEVQLNLNNGNSEAAIDCLKKYINEKGYEKINDDEYNVINAYKNLAMLIAACKLEYDNMGINLIEYGKKGYEYIDKEETINYISKFAEHSEYLLDEDKKISDDIINLQSNYCDYMYTVEKFVVFNTYFFQNYAYFYRDEDYSDPYTGDKYLNKLQSYSTYITEEDCNFDGEMKNYYDKVTQDTEKIKSYFEGIKQIEDASNDEIHANIFTIEFDVKECREKSVQKKLNYAQNSKPQLNFSSIDDNRAEFETIVKTVIMPKRDEIFSSVKTIMDSQQVS